MRDRVIDTTVRISFHTNDGDGAPVAPSSAFAASDFAIYKDGSATQKTSTNGITVTSPFDSLVGLHLIEIDTSNDTDDAGFWSLNSEYRIAINSAKTVDGVSQSGVIVGEFRLVSGTVELDSATIASIQNGVVLANSAHGGSGATLTLGAVTITVSGSTPNITLAGSGSGNGIEWTRSGSGDPLDQDIVDQIQDGIGGGATAQEVWEYATRSLTEAVELDSATLTLINDIPTNAELAAALAAITSQAVNTVTRSVDDTNPLTFNWPVSGATITATRSINNAAYGAVAGAIAFLRTESAKHYYTLAHNAADRPTAEGTVRYKFDDGTYTRYVVMAVAGTGGASGGASLEDIISGVQGVSGAIVEAQNSATLSIRIGDTWTQDIESLGNLADKTVCFALKKRASDADTAAIVFITEGTGLTRLNGVATTAGWGSIEILDEAAGDIRLRLESDATALLTSGTYVDAVKLLEDGDDRSPRNAGRTVVSAGVIADIT